MWRAQAALSTMIVPRHVLGGVGYNAPSDTVNFALIGAGGGGQPPSEAQLAAMQKAQEVLTTDY